jgi:hypothetical protein
VEWRTSSAPLSQIAHSRTIQPRLKALDVARVTPLRC